MRYFTTCLAILGLSLLLPGCFLKSSYQPPWPNFPDPRQIQAPQVINALDQRNTPWQTAHSQVQIKWMTPEGSQPKLTGEMFMKKPNQIRLRTYNPMGLIAFDLLYDQNQIELYLPHRKEVVIIPIDQKDELTFGDTPLALPNPQDWWRILQPWNGIEDRSLEHMEILTTANPKTGVLSLEGDQFTFEWKTGRMTDILLNGKITLRYQDWKSKNNFEYASLIDMKQYRNPDPRAAPVMAMTMEITKMVWNPPLNADIFKPVNKSLLTTTDLGKKPAE